jgi:NAD(P)H dehydrogenase (quinone)
MSQGTVLVTGATGDTGGATVEQLLARGRHVRALAHRKDARSERLQELGAEVVFGDFLDLDAIRAVVQEVQHAYFCYPIRPGIIQATTCFA